MPDNSLPSQQNLNPRDMSQRGGNSTSALQGVYKQLMSMTDLDTLKQQALTTVKPLVGKGISQANWVKFQRAVAQSETLERMQFYITNYILAGSGLSVAEDAMSALSSLVNEHMIPVELSDSQYRLKSLVESYGYHVTVVRPMLLG